MTTGSSSTHVTGEANRSHSRWKGEQLLISAIQDCRFSAANRDMDGFLFRCVNVNEDEHVEEEGKGRNGDERRPKERRDVFQIFEFLWRHLLRFVPLHGEAAVRTRRSRDGVLPCLLVLQGILHLRIAELIRPCSDDDPFRFGGRRFFHPRSSEAALCCLVLDTCGARLNISETSTHTDKDELKPTTCGLSVTVTAQLISCGGFVRVAEACKFRGFAARGCQLFSSARGNGSARKRAKKSQDGQGGFGFEFADPHERTVASDGDGAILDTYHFTLLWMSPSES